MVMMTSLVFTHLERPRLQAESLKHELVAVHPWDVDGARSAHDAPGHAAGVTQLAQGNDFVGIALTTGVSDPATAWWAPVETVSNSEGGFERVYQGAGLLLSWPLALAPGATWTVTVTQAVATDRDLADGIAT